MQDPASKYREKDIMLYVPKAIDRGSMYRESLVSVPGTPEPDESRLVGNEAYRKWIETLRLAQRPKWSDNEVASCFICEIEFSSFER